MKLDISSLNKVNVWITLPNLDLQFWNAIMLGKIVSCVGKPCHTDKLTEYLRRGDPDGRISYARVLVELDASVELKDEILLRGKNRVEIKQQIVYD